MKTKFLLFFLSCAVFLGACGHTPVSTKHKNIEPFQAKSNRQIPDRISIAHNKWEAMGSPVYPIEAYQDLFYKRRLGRFEITADLIHKADDFLYRLDEADYVRIFQRHTTPESMHVVHHKVMQKEYLYTNEGPFTMETHADGNQTLVHSPQENGYQVDFTTIFSADSAQQSYKIDMIFHANHLYGQPLGLDSWAVANYSKKGTVLCCAVPSTLAAYQKTADSEFTMVSELLAFPYFKRTEVLKHLQDDLVVKVDSTIRILKFGVHRVLSVGDQKTFVNGRLDRDFVNPQLQLDLEY